MLYLLFFAVLYFIPTWVAKYHRHHNATAIFAVNLFLGWTFLGWVVALAWALTRPAVAGQSGTSHPGVSPPVLPRPSLNHALAAVGILGGLLLVLGILAAARSDQASSTPTTEVTHEEGLAKPVADEAWRPAVASFSSPASTPTPTPSPHRHRHHHG